MLNILTLFVYDIATCVCVYDLQEIQHIVEFQPQVFALIDLEMIHLQIMMISK